MRFWGRVLWVTAAEGEACEVSDLPAEIREVVKGTWPVPSGAKLPHHHQGGVALSTPFSTQPNLEVAYFFCEERTGFLSAPFAKAYKFLLFS